MNAIRSKLFIVLTVLAVALTVVSSAGASIPPIAG